MGIKVRGTRKIRKNIARMAQRLTKGSDKGLKKVAKAISRDVGWSGGEPLIPVRTGNLRRSWFTIAYKPRGDRARAIRFGYRARYAEYQHNPEKFSDSWPRWQYTRKGSGRFYFKSTVNQMRHSGAMKKTIERHIRYQLRRK